MVIGINAGDMYTRCLSGIASQFNAVRECVRACTCICSPVQDLLLGHEHVLVGQVLGEAQDAGATGNDGHLQQGVGVLQEPAVWGKEQGGHSDASMLQEPAVWGMVQRAHLDRPACSRNQLYRKSSKEHIQTGQHAPETNCTGKMARSKFRQSPGDCRATREETGHMDRMMRGLECR